MHPPLFLANTRRPSSTLYGANTSCARKPQRQDAAAADDHDDDDEKEEGVVHGSKPDIVYRGVCGSICCGRRSASSSSSSLSLLSLMNTFIHSHKAAQNKKKELN